MLLFTHNLTLVLGMVRIHDVQIIRAGQTQMQHFSWTIKEGENWIVAGKNGCGKTTLLELLAGNLHASHGNITYSFVEGDTWEQRYWDKKRKIKLIPTHAIHTLLRGNRELYYQQRYYASAGEPRLVRSLFENDLARIHDLKLPASLNVEALLDRGIDRLSNGQLKKILLLQSVLHGAPHMLLLDYPFEGLDRQSREDLSVFIDFISREHGVQIIVVDHHHHLPQVINRRLMLDNFQIVDEAVINPGFTAGQRKVEKKIITADHGSYQQPIVDIRNLCIRYGNTVVIDNFNWTIYPGDRWALLGRNGSGKTTLFSLIFADHPMAYSQEIYLFGKRRGSGESIWDIKKRINYLGPELVSYLNPSTIFMSAQNYITSLHKGSDQKKLDALIEYFGAAEWFSRPVRFLSSGELQLMLIVSAFLEEKEILLLDEPFQFLDTEKRDRVAAYLQRHLSTQTTLILITHYEEDIATWTEKTITLA